MNAEPSVQTTPAFNIAAEQGLIGSVLLRNETYDAACSHVSADDFADPVHADIWRVLSNEIEAGRSVSPITLRDKLAGNADFARRGLSYLVQICKATITTVNARGYAEAIRDMAVRRGAQMAGRTLAEEAPIAADGRALVEEAINHLERLIGERNSDIASASTVVQSVDERMAQVEEHGLHAFYVPTGLADLDSATGGLPKSEVTVCGARPGMGKTALGTSIALNVARAGIPVGFVSLEMPPEQLVTRIAAGEAGIEPERVRKGRLDADERERFRRAAQSIAGLPITFGGGHGMTVRQITATARTLHRQGQCNLLIVDYLGLVQADDRYRGHRVYEIEEVTRALKALANRLDIPVLLLAQLSRELERRDDKRPILSDLRDSGAIEQDAGVVIFLYREEYYLGRREPEPSDAAACADWRADMDNCRGLAEIIFAKNRHGESNRTVTVHFDAARTRFGNIARGV